MNDSRTHKILNFEGAGWAGADSSKATNLTNCRIRTTFVNDLGKKIYLELGVYDNRKLDSKIKSHQGFLMPWHINFLFYTEEGSRHCSEAFQHDFNNTQEYTKENLLSFVNKVCSASFEKIEVHNWTGDRSSASWDGFAHTGKTKDDFHNDIKK